MGLKDGENQIDGYISKRGEKMLKIDEINNLIKQDINSDKKRIAKIGMNYYEGNHDIRNYRLFYYDTDNELVEDTSRSNIKISHPFFTEIVDQETQFLLSGFEITSKDDYLNDELKKYFNENFKAELSDTVDGTIQYGWNYMYAYLAADKRTRFKNADAMGVIEVREHESDDNSRYIIYWYVDRIDKNKKKIIKIEVWDVNLKYYYIKEGINGKIELDGNEEINPRPHKVYIKNGKKVYKPSNPGYGFIPFFKLNNNRKQISGLKSIKALIDDYDLMSCGLSNNLQDISEGIYVVKGFKRK